MKKKVSLTLKASLLLALPCILHSRADQPIELGPPDVILHRTNPHIAGQPTAGSTSATTPISYHGGPVMGTPNVYVIWYGDWNQANGTDTAAGQQIVRDFLSNIGGSPYYKINTKCSAGGSTIVGAVNYGGETTDAYSQGKKLTDQKVANVVARAINGADLPADENGIYFVLTSSDVNELSGFCTRYCGWHTYGSLSGLNIKYSFVGNAARCLRSCAAQSVGPNGNAGVDGMISVVAHELEEANSDPNLNAWYDSSGAENADKCAWTFGQNQYPTANGAYANVHLGSRDYLIQRNLLRGTSKGDVCAISYDPSTGNYAQ